MLLLQTHRDTPQAFSYFTFDHTDGAEVVVDVQGVGVRLQLIKLCRFL